MDNNELHNRLDKLGIKIPEGTLRRWVHEGIIPRPRSVHKGKGGGAGRFSEWPEDTVEQAATVYVLRHSDLQSIKPTTQAIIETREVVNKFYTVVEESKSGGLDASNKFLSMMTYVQTPEGTRRMMWISKKLHPLIVLWIVTVEKIRNGKPLNEHYQATFKWTKYGMHVGLKEVYRLRYDGVTFTPASEDMLGLDFSAAPELGFESRVFSPTMNWDFVKVNVEKQTITITDQEKAEISVIDLKNSGYRIVDNEK